MVGYGPTISWLRVVRSTAVQQPLPYYLFKKTTKNARRSVFFFFLRLMSNKNLWECYRKLITKEHRYLDWIIHRRRRKELCVFFRLKPETRDDVDPPLNKKFFNWVLCLDFYFSEKKYFAVEKLGRVLIVLGFNPCRVRTFLGPKNVLRKTHNPVPYA